MEHSFRPILNLLMCFIGAAWGIFTVWIIRQVYSFPPGLEDNGLDYILFFVVGILAAMFFYLWRISRLSIGKALIAICIVFAGGCLGAILAQAVTYYFLFGLISYFVGLGLGNVIAYKMGM